MTPPSTNGTWLAKVLRPVRAWFRKLRTGDRVRVEDALKHIHECSYRGHRATLSSLSGALALDGDRTAKLLARLQQLGLVLSAEDGYVLSEPGRTYALRVIRIHRLWERYLADETGLDAAEWHSRAEVREHRTSPREAERLAARMGHPRYDPHGDPIPTADGEIGPRRGQPLTETPAGCNTRIVHVEDEPATVYRTLLRKGLHPGMQLEVLAREAGRLRLWTDAGECEIDAIVAANLWVTPLRDGQRIGGPRGTLADLVPGGRGTIAGIALACRGTQRRRLLDLGIVPGTEVSVAFRSPSGDPTAYRIRGALVALRRAQAALVQIETAAGEAP